MIEVCELQCNVNEYVTKFSLTHRCGEKGHLARECPDDVQDDRKCYNCGEVGHLSRDCTNERSYGSSYSRQDERKCYKYDFYGYKGRF